MSRLFNNYLKPSPKLGGDNKVKTLDQEPEFFDTISPGANCNHLFRIDFPKNKIFNLDIYYKQGTETVVVKHYSDVTIEDKRFGNRHYSIIKYTVTAEETSKFNNYNDSCEVQLKLLLVDGTTTYSPKFKIKLLDNVFTDFKDLSKNTSDIAPTRRNISEEDDTKNYLEAMLDAKYF